MFDGFIERGGDYTLRCGWCKFSYSFSREMATDKELALTVLNKHIGDSSSGLSRCEFISGETNTSSIYIKQRFFGKYFGKPETYMKAYMFFIFDI